VLAGCDVPLGGRTVSLVCPRSAEELIDEDAFARDERLPYWADLWPSARVLAARLVVERGRGRTLMELGCGLGLVTIAALRAGYDVLATDYYEDALRFTRANARRAVHRVPEVRLVDWRSLPQGLGTFARVVAADVLYESAYGPLVAEVLARTLARHGHATIADPGRAAAPEFVRRCQALGMRVDAGEPVRYEEGTIRQRIQLYDVRWPSGAAG